MNVVKRRALARKIGEGKKPPRPPIAVCGLALEGIGRLAKQARGESEGAGRPLSGTDFNLSTGGFGFSRRLK